MADTKYKSVPLVLDNGGWIIRAGFAGLKDPLVSVPNCTAKIEKQIETLVADQTETTIKDLSQLNYIRPIQRGYISDWDTQYTIWDRVFRHLLKVNPAEHPLVLTFPYFAPKRVLTYLLEVVFEELKCPSLALVPCAATTMIEHVGTHAVDFSMALPDTMSQQQIQKLENLASTNPSIAVRQLPKTLRCGITIDSGFSWTLVSPILNGSVFRAGIKRVDVGGKFITNYLKDILSYRQWNIQDSFMEANRMKEQLCYIAGDYDIEWPYAHALNNPSILSALQRAYYRTSYGKLRRGQASIFEVCAWAHLQVIALSGYMTDFMKQYRTDLQVQEKMLTNGTVDTTTMNSNGDRTGTKHPSSTIRPDDDTHETSSVRNENKFVIPKVWLIDAQRTYETPSTFGTASNSSQSLSQSEISDGYKALCRIPEAMEAIQLGVSLLNARRASSKNTYVQSIFDGKHDGIGFGLRREIILPDKVNVHQSYIKGSSNDPYAYKRLQQLFPETTNQASTQVNMNHSNISSEAQNTTPSTHDPISVQAVSVEEPDTHMTTMIINSERIAAPELLFTPGDVGLDQGGVADAVQRAIEACPAEWQPLLWTNIVLTGGCAKLTGYPYRLTRELRKRAPAKCPVRVSCADDPINSAWKGASAFAASPSFSKFSVSKHQYESLGVEKTIDLLLERMDDIGPFLYHDTEDLHRIEKLTSSTIQPKPIGVSAFMEAAGLVAADVVAENKYALGIASHTSNLSSTKNQEGLNNTTNIVGGRGKKRRPRGRPPGSKTARIS